MSENIIADLDLWLASIATGACMALAYDFLRLLRRLVRHGRLAVDLEDMLYWTVCFFASFTLLYYGNNGVIRFVAVLGAALGMFLYTVSIGKVFVKFSYFLINETIGRLLRLIARIVRKFKQKLLTYCAFCNKIKKSRDFFIPKKREGRSAYGKKHFWKKEKNAKIPPVKK